MRRSRSLSTLLLVAALGGAAACDTSVDGGGGDGTGDGTGDGVGDGTGDGVGDGEPAPVDPWQDLLDQRQYNYGAALRTASLRLTGDLPTVEDIEKVSGADAKTQYETLVRGYLEDPRFAPQALAFWRDTFRMGGTAELDTAPALAASIKVGNRSYLELLTATTGTCPTVNAQGVVTAANCNNNVTTHAGVLTNPGVMKHFASNLAFRRTRWVQEIFACTAFPAEIGAPTPVGNDASYTAPWPFESIAGTSNGGRIDFLDTAGVVCANCHATMNHVAPLFANFDDNGRMTNAIAVKTPLDGEPLATLADYLPAGLPMRQAVVCWPAADLPALGAAMAADPLIAECAVARAWNWALGRGDIVNTLSVVPSEVIAAQVAAFTGNGHKFKDLLYAVFTSDDFTKY